MSGNVGRKKVEGGHKRVNISLSNEVLNDLRKLRIKNLSRHVEHCLKLYGKLSEYELEVVKLLVEARNYGLACALFSQIWREPVHGSLPKEWLE